MRSSSGKINISASAQKLDVDNRISLRYYFRIADNVLKQADIFREEDNIIDLYVMLLRFSSLVSETIPCHREYRASPQGSKMYLKKRLLKAVNELEKLKPEVQKKIDEVNKKHMYQITRYDHKESNITSNSSMEWPSIKNHNTMSYAITKAPGIVTQNFAYPGLRPQLMHNKPLEEQIHRLSLSVPRAKDETLSRHSIWGPNGLHGQWRPPSSYKVQYPSSIDLTPVEIPRLLETAENEVSNESNIAHSKTEISHLKICQSSETRPSENVAEKSEQERSSEEIISVNTKKEMRHTEELDSLISFEPIETPVQINIIRQPSPPPVLADVQDLVVAPPPITQGEFVSQNSNTDGLVSSEAPLELHISTTLMDSFMRMAKSNTDKNLETCGVLAGSLKNRKFSITALIIPKQESTSDSCQTTNEEDIFEVQDKRSLFPLGWIHTHPTQSCFMSSIDVHTHYSYQIMLPEAIAIVMAPKDSSKNHGIFRLTSGGLTVIRHCPRRGFHAHDPPVDGGPIYKQCTDVYLNPKTEFDVIDLR
ncbi:AMSH-like ubiquitin thioesterase 1 [Impatiens glandulifera]|uniref:AMSH-like ubiquitin thioesterase 1 n=1 Tax=Impatiens glandulifera TaxID=253017 RepID=UPI001FB10F08|nr:AMSH-like ubiquitin thioesterase 1 [Impatiens glandulifera]